MVKLTDSTGAVTKSYDYDAFGNEVNPDSSDVNPFRYCGEYFDKETGTIYLRARYYSPTIGRFTQEDFAKDGLNYYTYCNNNPVIYVDPSGLFGVPVRELVELLGGTVSWDAKNKEAIVTFGDSSVTLAPGDCEGGEVYIDKSGTMYVEDWYLESCFDNLIIQEDAGTGYHGYEASIVFSDGKHIHGNSVNKLTFDDTKDGQKAADEYNDDVNKQANGGIGMICLLGGPFASKPVTVAADTYAAITYVFPIDFSLDLEGGETLITMFRSGGDECSMARPTSYFRICVFNSQGQCRIDKNETFN